MNKVACLLVLVVLVSFVACSPLRKVMSTENKYDEKLWMNRGRAPRDHPVEFSLFLKQKNLDILDQIYEDRINPTSENYRQWMEIEEINDIVSPSKFEKLAIKTWLKVDGVNEIIDNGDAIKVLATAEAAEKIFNTYFYVFEQRFTNKVICKQLGEYSVPRAVSPIVEFVTGIKTFSVDKRLKSHARTALDDQEGKVVPSVISTLYGIPTNLPANTNSSVCLAEFQDDRSFAASDLASFQTENDLPNNPIYKTVGPYNPTFPDAESTLDVEYAAGVVIDGPVWFWTSAGWMLDFANDFYSTNPAPYVVSMSWGWTENNQCEITDCGGLTSQQYVARVNTEFQKIGLRGITLLAASGDQGAPGDGDPYCLSATAPISSIFPGASPYVTAVGATMLVNNSENDEVIVENPAAEPPVCSKVTCANPATTHEEVCSYPTALITTGGGFSNYSPVPSWQQTVVSAYLSSGVDLPPSADFNSSNRGFPDVSAVGHNYLITINGEDLTVDGTSCSTPVWGGMVAVLNNQLMAAGKPTLGPINPLLYQIYADQPSAFNDIATGNNKCSEAECCKVGYVSASGWDPVTGLGTPNFATISSYIMNM